MLAEDEARRILVREARSWIGTPYHPGADLCGVGVDCGMLLVRVLVDAGLVPAFDPRPYPQDWHLHRDDERYLGFVFDRAAEARSRSISAGPAARSPPPARPTRGTA